MKSKKSDSKKKKSQPKDDRTPEQRRADQIRTMAGRETVEAFVVAFVLALLFRAFVAEAFVIPTGSMAPALMGAHKDIACSQCNHQFRIGASLERRGTQQGFAVIGGYCPNCNYLNNLDLANNADHSTFNGDRILVSKSAYVLSDPERWDVIVFKFPGNPKQNYIKRLVGLPDESISIQHGDIYARPRGTAPTQDTVLRKPPTKLLAMRHHVYDSDQQSRLLISSDYPTRLQPWRRGAESPPTDSWQITRNQEGVVAEIKSKGDSLNWLRYFHRYPTQTEWSVAENDGKLDGVDPYSCRLVSDVYAYNYYINAPSTYVYERSPRIGGWTKPPFDSDYESGGSHTQFRSAVRFGNRQSSNQAINWVSDLILEANVQLGDDCTELVLEIVECGLQYQCRVDTKTGKATLAIIDDYKSVVANQTGDIAMPTEKTAVGKPGKPSFDGGKAGAAPSADTEIKAGKSVEVRFSNCDDELLLWVDNTLVEFDAPTTFRMRDFRTIAESHPYYRPGEHPLDGAPIGVAARGNATIDAIRVYRDKYYCATDNSGYGIYDYQYAGQWAPTDRDRKSIWSLMETPNAWENSDIWQKRRKVSFETEADQFFPMGDNSPESQDARCWAGVKKGRLPERFQESAYKYADASYVPRDLLVGKALLVFWPHHWQSPVPYPNLGRIRLIR